MKSQLRPALISLLLLTLLTGLLYPALVTAIAKTLFPRQADGSPILTPDGHPHGSTLIAQPFTSPQYFWPRPSATTPTPYNAASSGGSNLAPTNPALTAAIRQRIAALQSADPTNNLPIPIDLITTSASGLDPHISPAAAYYQAPRIARTRHLPLPTIQHLITQHTEPRTLGLLGEPRVNVLQLNLALDQTPTPPTTSTIAITRN